METMIYMLIAAVCVGGIAWWAYLAGFDKAVEMMMETVKPSIVDYRSWLNFHIEKTGRSEDSIAKTLYDLQSKNMLLLYKREKNIEKIILFFDKDLDSLIDLAYITDERG